MVIVIKYNGKIPFFSGGKAKGLRSEPVPLLCRMIARGYSFFSKTGFSRGGVPELLNRRFSPAESQSNE